MTEHPDKPPFDQDEFRARQRSRAIVMALILGGFVALFYAITIARIGGAS